VKESDTVNGDEYTPAFYAFSQRLAPVVVGKNKYVAEKFLKKECAVYRLAFKCYAMSREMHNTQDQLFNYFRDVVRGNGTIEADDDQMNLLGRAFFDEYWELAKREIYWENGKRNKLDGLRKYSEFVKIWRTETVSDLSDAAIWLQQTREQLYA
jgi:hypothetical protein